MQNAENITIKNCNFDQIGGNGVFFSGYNRNRFVFNNIFTDAGASCVCLFGLRSSIRCPNSWSNAGSCSDRTPGPLTEEYPAYITVSNNMMNRLGIFEKQVAGVTGSATMCDTIRHNTIHDMPRSGINFCDGCFGGHVVEYNWVYNCVQETSDHGPFNSWGRDRNERWGSDSSASKLDAWKTTIIRQNRFEAPNGMFGIDLDDQSTNYLQYNNLLIGGGLKVQFNRYNTYLNNILCRGANVQFHGVWDKSAHHGARNIIAGSQTCLYQTCCGSNASQVAGTGTKWDSNAVYSPAGTPNITSWNGCGSQVNSWSEWTGAGLDRNSITSNPGFVDTQKVWRADYQPRGDFNPPSSSLAMTQLKFQPFVMDSFGVMPVTEVTSISGQFKTKGIQTPDCKSLVINFNSNRLTV